MKESKVVEYYQDIQALVGLVSDPKDGYTWALPKDPSDLKKGVSRVIVPEAKRLLLAMPTDQYLEDIDHEHYVTFHPLCESSLCAESPVIDFLRKHSARALGERALVLAGKLIELGVASDLHPEMNAKQMRVLAEAVADPKKVTITDFGKLQAGYVTVNNLFSLYVKRGGTFLDQTVMRVCTVRSPIMTQFSDALKTVNDSDKLTERSYTNVKKVLTYLCGPAQEGEFDHGTNNGVAPYLDALLQSVVKVQEHLNEIATTMKEFLGEDFDFIYASTALIRKHKHFREYSAMIPVMPYNSGAELSKGLESQEQTVAPQGVQAAQNAPQSDWNSPSSNQESSGGDSIESRIAAIKADRNLSNYEKNLKINALKEQSVGFGDRNAQPSNWNNQQQGGWNNQQQQGGWNNQQQQQQQGGWASQYNNNGGGGWSSNSGGGFSSGGGWGGNNLTAR